MAVKRRKKEYVLLKALAPLAISLLITLVALFIGICIYGFQLKNKTQEALAHLKLQEGSIDNININDHKHLFALDKFELSSISISDVQDNKAFKIEQTPYIYPRQYSIFLNIDNSQVIAHYNATKPFRGFLYIILWFITSTTASWIFMSFYLVKKLKEQEEISIREEQRLFRMDKENEILLKQIFDQIGLGIAINVLKGNLVIDSAETFTVNSAFEKNTGYSKKEMEHINWRELTHPDDLVKEEKLLSSFLNGDLKHYDFEKRIRKPDSTYSWVRLLVTHLYKDDKGEWRYVCFLEDIQERKKLDLLLNQVKHSKSILLNNLPGVFFRYTFKEHWEVSFFSDEILEISGYESSYFSDSEKPYTCIIKQEHLDKVKDAWHNALQSLGGYKVEYEIITAKQGSLWVLEQGGAVLDNESGEYILEGVIIDINNRKKMNMNLQHITNANPITQMSGWNGLYSSITKETGNRIISKKAVIMVRLRDFNILNLSYGYVYTEFVIKEIATSLENLCQDKYEIFHISIESFVVFVDEFLTQSELNDFCNEIKHMLQNGFAHTILGADIGVYEFSPFITDVENILKNASFAADNCDKSIRFDCVFFDDPMRRDADRKQNIMQELTEFLYSKGPQSLVLEYQPVFNFKDGSVYSFEALSRFKSDSLGLIKPDEFIPIAEESRLIVPLEKKIFNEAFGVLKNMISLYDKNIIVSVNISLVTIMREDFIDELNALVEFHQLEPSSIMLEISERYTTISRKELNARVDALRKLGYLTAIDDFGTGSASLFTKIHTPTDYIKISDHFLSKDLSKEDSIFGPILSIAQKRDFKLIAKGINNEQQITALQNYGCNLGQGFYFSKPLSKKEALAYIAKTPLIQIP